MSGSQSQSPRTAKRPRRVVESDDEADVDGHDSQPGPSSRARPLANGNGHGKRPRPSQATDGHGGGGDDDDPSEDESDVDMMDDSQRLVNGNGELAPRPVIERGADDYVAGSVVRVKIRNFMTYDLVEFCPGPYLNMILGPNGTGKSTIAAAIAIGLGFKPKVMGRARDLDQYVKQGTEVAELEVELKARAGARNPVIWRRFRKDSKGSEFRLNGSSATHRQVRQVVSGFGVQAENLCSFLPQDRVSEFAKMDPVTVLVETLGAAGDPRLTDWRAQLIDKGSKAREVQEVLERETQQRDNLQAQVTNLEPDVESFRSRRDLEVEVELLKLLISTGKVTQQRNKVTELREWRTQAANRLREAQNRNKPLMQLKAFVERENTKACNQADDATGKLGAISKEWKAAGKAIAKAENDCKAVDDELAAVREKLRNREKQLQRYRESVAKCDAVLAAPRQDLTDQVTARQQEKRRATEDYNKAREKRDELEAKKTEQDRELIALNSEIDNLGRELARKTDVQKQRELAARELDGSLNFAIDWISKHEGELEEQVFLPPMITVNMKNPTLAAQVENCTSLQVRSLSRQTIICTNQNDYRRLLALNGQSYGPYTPQGSSRHVPGGRVALHLSKIELSEEAANPPRPAPIGKLAELGFDGYAIDFVDAPPAVTIFLMQNANLHRACVTRREGHSIDSDRAVQAGIMRWATKTDTTQALRSRYGQQATQSTTQPIRPAKAFNQSVDQRAVTLLSNELGERKRRKQALEGPNNDTAKAVDQARQKQQAMRQEIDRLTEAINDLRKKENEANRAHVDKERLLSNIAKLEAEPSAAEEREKLKAQKYKHAKAQVAPLKEHLGASTRAVALLDAVLKSGFMCLQTAQNAKAVEQRHKDEQHSEHEIQRELNEAKVKAEEAKRRFTNMMAAYEAEIARAPRDIRDSFSARNQETPKEGAALEEFIVESENMLQDAQSQLSLSVGISPAIMERYNRLSEQLEAKRAEVDDKEKTYGRLKRDVDDVLGKYNPALDKLVDFVSERFSAYFEKMGCTGEVRVRRVEGRYEEWGIEILVSYRNTERLAVLTANRQSGGERSLATVTYLMSLCEMARTPFSLVDEINQGMDQRVERMVHDRMVKATCADHAGQYFLITPKLLTGLTYHPNMKVLVVNNGTWLPDSADRSQRFGSLKSCLVKYKQHHAIAA